MFGGHGVYCRGAIFAIVFKNRLYFKTDGATCAKYTARNMGPFRPGPAQVMKNYHEVPGDVIEEVPLLCEWAIESIAIARSTAR
jgi:DNA transformation protein